MKRRQFLAFSTLAGFTNTLKAKTIKSHTGLVLDERFIEHHISPAHPESPARYQAITEHLLAQDLLNKVTLLEPKNDVEAWLELIHSKEHIATIKHNDLVNHQHALIATGAVLTAVEQVCSGKLKNIFCASRPPGHHALNTGKEEGFCYYNHAAIAARYAQQKYDLKKL